MAISCWERFTGNDWERYANITGGISSVMVVFFAVMTWVFKFNAGIGAYTFFVGLFMMFFETPVVSWIGPCGKCRKFIDDNLFMKHPAVRAIVYVCLSILTFMYKTPSIGGGMFMLLTAILKSFAQCNVVADANDNKGLKQDLSSNQA